MKNLSKTPSKTKDPKRVAAGKKSRNKGKRSEGELCKHIGEYFGCLVDTKFQGHPDYYLNYIKRTARDRQNGLGDIWMAESMKKKFSWTPEVKDRQGWRLDSLLVGATAWIASWWDQAVEQSQGTSYPPLLIFKQNGTPWNVCFRLSDLPSPQLPEAYICVKLGTLLAASECVIINLDVFLRFYYNDEDRFISAGVGTIENSLAAGCS